MAGEKDVTFDVDKYGNPHLLTFKESIAQQIINALFMVPGNLPSLPHVGVNIRQYFYKTDTEFVSSEIEQKLKEACGLIISGVVINSVDFSVQTTSTGQAIFLLMIRILFPNSKNESVLGISLKDEKKLVKFNFAYSSDV